MATIGKAFKISPKQVKGYGYAKPNPGVTAIAAINGRGAYGRAKSARSAMSGLSQSARVKRARQLTETERAQFAARVQQAKGQGMYYMNKGKAGTGHRSAKAIRAARQNIKAAQAARAAWGRKLTPGVRYRIGEAAYGEKPGARKLVTGVYAANRRRRLAAMFNMNRKRRVKRRQTAKQRAASLRNLAKGRRKLSPNRKRRAAPKRRAKANKRTSLRRNKSAKRAAAARKGWRKRKLSPNRKRRAAPKRRAKANKRTSLRRNKSAKRRAAPKRRAKANKRTSLRRNKRAYRRHLKLNANGRRYGRNAFRKNQWKETLMGALKAGAFITAGFVAQKAISKVLSDFVVDKIIGTAPAAATPTTPAATPAVSGFEALQPYKGIIASAMAAALGIVATGYVVKDVETKKLVMGGMAASFVHTALVQMLAKTAPTAAGYLSGYHDATAARLSAMFGMGGVEKTSILPQYAPIGMGEYFSEPVSGLGEFFAESVNGLGNYGGNPDLYQAAAGYGAVAFDNANHVDPSSNLDRELSLAEAAAGVGQVAYQAAAGVGQAYQAAAGIGEYFSEAVNGLGAIATLPSANTWIPGMADPKIWAGVRRVDEGQASNAMVPAGVLQSGGGQGVFG